ncbi:hypothetical protein T01_5804 [Trichinella spiralis]|uniref:Uncharacterized protein n=1 Tax=Trichinella spiralis TaxID=6334 RepID=A0A0V1BR64_TRISP|nr:hypothetical protein T01_5804 [Trichinella spiralis]
MKTEKLECGKVQLLLILFVYRVVMLKEEEKSLEYDDALLLPLSLREICIGGATWQRNPRYTMARRTGRPRRSPRLAWASIQRRKFSAKVDVSEINGQRVDQHRRFAIVRQFVNPELGVCKFCRPFKPHSKPPNKPSSANAFFS